MKLDKWLDDAIADEHVVFVKRLAGNDTLATKSHQAGPYVPKEVVETIAPGLLEERTLNPRRTFKAYTDSSPSSQREVRLIWYNNRVVESGSRNECRLTGWGGRKSDVLDPESTGAIAVFSFQPSSATVRVWVCRNIEEEELAEARLGRVEPGEGRVLPLARAGEPTPPLRQKGDGAEVIDFPEEWAKKWPSGMEIAALAASRIKPEATRSLDDRLVRLREIESALFNRIEEAHALPLMKTPPKSFKELRAAVMSIVQRARKRSGFSLEAHVRRILEEERIPYDHPGKTEGTKKPDFILPSNRDYADPSFPRERLRMLALKTTLRDRWSEVVIEADKIKKKHVLTLDQGVSENQFKEMVQADLQLIVPLPLHKSFPPTVREHLMTLDGFVAECRALGWRRRGQQALLLPEDQ